MAKVSMRFDMCFIVMRGINNQPGVAALIMESLAEAGVRVEAFQAVAHPQSPYADVLMLAMSSEDASKALRGIKSADGKIGGYPPTIIENLVGIAITGIRLEVSTDVLRRAFKVCGSLGVNVAMSYTTIVSLHIFVDSKDYSEELIHALEEEFKEG